MACCSVSTGYSFDTPHSYVFAAYVKSQSDKVSNLSFNKFRRCKVLRCCFHLVQDPEFMPDLNEL